MIIDRALSGAQDDSMNANHDHLNRAEQLVEQGNSRSAISLLEIAGSYDDLLLAERRVRRRS